MRHRLALVAAVAVLGGLTLAGCQRDPEVAARVDGEVITEAQVDQIFNDSPPATPPAAAPPTQGAQAAQAEVPAGPTRADVVKTLVLDKLCENLRAKEQFRVAAITPESVAAQENVTAQSAYAKQQAKTESCLSGAVATASPGRPTDAELMDIYNRAKAGGVNVGAFEDVKASLVDEEQVQQYIGVKRALDRVINSGTIELNPRYRGLEFGLSDLNSGVAVIVSTIGGPGSDAIQP